MYKRGLITGVLLSVPAYFLLGYALELAIYYLQLTAHPLSTESIEAGPFKLTLSNATEWTTVAKMVVTILATYAGFKIINEYIK